jgi:hypothetical protein
MPSPDWYVYYRISGYDAQFKAGPYSEEELEYHRMDISLYAGVYDVQVRQEITPENPPPTVWERILKPSL